MPRNYPKEFQCLVLFAALSGREFSKTELGIKIKIAQIDGYAAEEGLLSVRRKGNTRILSANSETLRWTGANLKNVELVGTGKALRALLGLLCAKTAAYSNANPVSFSEFLRSGSIQKPPIAGVVPPDPTEPPRNPVEAVRRAYLELSGGSYDARILLKNLRKRLSIGREAQDMAFLDLIRSGEADFFAEDDPMSRTMEDEEAALILADRRRHLLYLHKEPRT